MTSVRGEWTETRTGCSAPTPRAAPTDVEMDAYTPLCSESARRVCAQPSGQARTSVRVQHVHVRHRRAGHQTPLPTSPYISLHLPTSPYISLHLPASPCISLHLPTSPCISLHLPTSPCISLHLPASPCISLHLPTSPYISLHLPTSPCIYLHLPMSPYISHRPSGASPRGRRRGRARAAA